MKASVLVIEDDAAVAADIRDILGRLGYEVCGPVATGEDAIRTAKDKRPDLALVDIRLPGDMDGIAAADVLRAQADMAIVYLTAFGDEATLQRAKRTQPHGYLLKPFAERDLRTAIEVALYKHRMEEFAPERERWFSSVDGDAVVAVDAQGLLTYANPAAAQLARAPQANALGQRLEDAFRVVDADGRPLAQAGRDEFHVLPAGDAPPVAFRDMTERRRLEKRAALAERVATAGALAAGMAHEIANPLTYVLANVRAVKDELLALAARKGEGSGKLGELAKLLGEAVSGLDRVGLVARNLVRFAGAARERRQFLDLPDIVDGAVRVVENLLRHRAQVELALGATPYVEAAEHELTQVIVSLLANAVEALEGEREQNRIVVRTLTDDAGRAVVEIRDNGGGASPEVLARAFEPFYTTKTTGAGLGLALARRVVTELGGEIGLASEPGRGTVARMTLPAARHEPSAARAPAVLARKRRFLIIEDEELVARALARILGREHEVIVETDPHLALARIARGEIYDIVFCDVMMPQMSGRAVFQSISVANAGLRDRVVFVTGGVFTPELEEFLASVKNPVLTKPFAAESIRALVASRLGG
ncbi:MAG TPA: response regulator [Haliangiales bacterium]|nr:response regulator [Haliangiales bacterium]